MDKTKLKAALMTPKGEIAEQKVAEYTFEKRGDFPNWHLPGEEMSGLARPYQVIAVRFVRLTQQ
ncbi:MAG: hypothetical protein DHS20C18_38680 [Saprospiraceae bacterium]|nr:MAG: hypothetical protein DHS20C18_38680 [Saprospiraceae bacterium]